MLFHVYATPSGGDNALLVAHDLLSFDDAYARAETLMRDGIPLTTGTCRACYACVIDDRGLPLVEIHDQAA